MGLLWHLGGLSVKWKLRPSGQEVQGPWSERVTVRGSHGQRESRSEGGPRTELIGATRRPPIESPPRSLCLSCWGGIPQPLLPDSNPHLLTQPQFTLRPGLCDTQHPCVQDFFILRN